jgi:glycerol-3-phosphate acyltransferase PlsY
MYDALTVSKVLYLLVPAAFLMGSVPFGIIFTRSKGVDIRSVGSRNIGATNVLRFAGKTSAILTLLGDTLKGVVPMILCSYALQHLVMDQVSGQDAGIVSDLWLGIVGISVVLGHMFSVFLSFRGGKGVATGFGVLLVYSPLAAGLILLVWMVTAFAFKYSALAALVAVSFLPIILFLFKASLVKLIAGSIISLLIIYRHKSNIRNLLSGTEDKIGGKAP